MKPTLLRPEIRAILLDIEGTTTPIAFVHEILFSYARHQVEKYLQEHLSSEEVAADLWRLRDEHALDIKQNLQPPALVSEPKDGGIDSMVAYVNWLIDQDRKSTGLKSLQGKIWKQGYTDGTLKSQVFADVPAAFDRWRRAGFKISIFSSGSTLAQRLLFSHTEAGDLSHFISNYFDTTVGSKRDVQSYLRIAAALDLPASEMLFISDIVGELAAADGAGMKTCLCVRPGNSPQQDSAQYQIIHSLDKI